MKFTAFSQKDSKWKYKKLGFSNVSFGNYGCLITALSSLYNITPLKMNDWLKNNNGYANLNLVVWTALPGFVWRGWSYDNKKVKDIIKKQKACIVEVDWDGNPRTRGSHFVLFRGSKQMIDPINGKIEPTNKYKILKGFAEIDIIKGRKFFKGGTVINKNALDICLKQHEELVNEAKEFKTTISKQAIELTKYKKAEKTLIDKLEDAGEKLIIAEGLKAKWHDLYRAMKKNNKSLKIDNAEFQRQMTNLKDLKVPKNNFLKKIFYLTLYMDQGLQKAKSSA